MNGPSDSRHDEELELRIAEWLQDGPFMAPPASVEGVIGEVRRRPRRHAALDRIRRVVMGVPAGDALEIGRRSRTTNSLAAAASVVLALGLLSTFGVMTLLAPATSPSPSTAPGPSAQASTAASATPAPSLAALPAAFTATSVCSEMNAGTLTHVGTMRLTTGIVLKCSDRASDPRMTGVGYRYYTTEIDPDGTQRWYGTATMSNAGGEWNGIWTGYQASFSAVLSNTTFWLGAKGYDGLQARASVEIGDNGIVVTSPSILEIVGSVSSTGIAVCTEPAAPPSLAPTAPAPDRILVCAVRVDDPRLSGTRTLLMTITPRGDGSAAISGTSRIENGAGAWDGQISGSLDADGRTYRIDEVATGSGLYAGFAFSGQLVGPAGQLAISGTITPAN